MFAPAEAGVYALYVCARRGWCCQPGQLIYIPGLQRVSDPACKSDCPRRLDVSDFLPRHQVRNHPAGFQQLVGKSFFQRIGHQARDHIGSGHSDKEREEHIWQNNFETNAHLKPSQPPGNRGISSIIQKYAELHITQIHIKTI